MNKEEIEERISYAKSNFTDGIEIFLEIIEKQQKELEQKESILNRVTGKLEEIRRELDDDGFGYYAQEITIVLNIIEGGIKND